MGYISVKKIKDNIISIFTRLTNNESNISALETNYEVLNSQGTNFAPIISSVQNNQNNFYFQWTKNFRIFKILIKTYSNIQNIIFGFVFVDFLGLENHLLTIRNKDYLSFKPYSSSVNKLHAFNKNELIELDFTRNSQKTSNNENGYLQGLSPNFADIQLDEDNQPFIKLNAQTTNFIKFSEDFSNNLWNFYDVNITPNSVLDPKNNLTGCRVVALSGSNKTFQQVFIVESSSEDRIFNGSLYLKSPNTNQCRFRVGGSTSNVSINITQKYKRFDSSYILEAGSTYVRLAIVLSNENDIIDCAFGQISHSEVVQPYVSTTDSFTTCLKDSFSKENIENHIDSKNMILYLKYSLHTELGGARAISTSDGTTNNRFFIYSYAGAILYQYVLNGVLLSAYTHSLADTTTIHKSALKLEGNTIYFFVDGALIHQSDEITSPDANTFNRIGSDSGTSGSPFVGNLYEAEIQQSTTNTQLQTLTTL
jgi:hypothetical protein